MGVTSKGNGGQTDPRASVRLSPSVCRALLLDLCDACLAPRITLEMRLRSACGVIVERLGYDLVWIGVPTTSDSLCIRASAGRYDVELAGRSIVGRRGMRGTPLSLRCLRTRTAVTARHAPAEPALVAPAQALAIVPLLDGEQCVGVLYVGTTIEYRFRETEVKLLQEAASRIGSCLAVLERLSSVERHERTNAEAAAVFDSAIEGIFITDLGGRIVAANPAVCRITGYTRDELMGATPALFRSGRHDESFYANFWRTLSVSGSWRGEIWNRRKNGQEYPELLCVSAIHDDKGAVVRYVALLVDLSEQKRIEHALEHKAHHDELTGLSNRSGLQREIDKVLNRVGAETDNVAVVVLDLDEFKYVNDTLGHDDGDALIRTIADRMRGCLRHEDKLARLGGDEFAILLPGLTHMHDAAIVTRKVLEAIAQPITVSRCELRVTASAGIAVSPEDGDTANVLLRRADSAMYRAKASGSGGFQYFRPEMETNASDRLVLGSALSNALSDGGLFLVYQPQADLDTGRLRGVEALLRWRHQGETISPDRFIPIAEKTGLIHAIGAWVIRESCRAAARWKAEGWHDVRVSVNLSPRQFHDRGLLATIRSALNESGLQAGHLEIEITESMAMSNPAHTASALAELRTLGVLVAIDDFGTGHSSLAALGTYPLDTLKIDLSFTQAIGTDPRVEIIVRTIIAMAKTLSLNLVAEGVETQEQADFLSGAGCRTIQGYLLGHPMEEAEFGQWRRGHGELHGADEAQSP